MESKQILIETEELQKCLEQEDLKIFNCTLSTEAEDALISHR